MIPRLLENGVAYFDTFVGLVRCRVLKLSGRSPVATSAVMVEFELLEARRAYNTGERFTRSSLWVVPTEALHRGKYQTVIGPYAVGPAT